MTANQFNAALKKLGLLQRDLAALLDTTDRSVRRWSSGQWPVPAPVGLLLNLMLTTNSSVEDLKR